MMPELNSIYTGDCLSVLAGWPENFVDTIITDPPYGLEFMGKDWDGDVPGVHFWTEMLRVAKPGAMLLTFGGTRTWHHLATAIEDAGWQIRDCLMWLYGSGFPKSLDISKAIDKANGRKFEDRYELGRHIRKCREERGVTRREVNEHFDSEAVCNHWEAQDQNNALPPTPQDWMELKKWLGCDSRFDYLVDRIGAEREVTGTAITNLTPYGNIGGKNNSGEIDITAPSTDLARQWSGWGTALKPAWEPIILAMKPLDGTFAENAERWGVAGLNVDGGRIASCAESFTDNRPDKVQQNAYGKYGTADYDGSKGRWPANLLLDEEAAAMLDGVSEGKIHGAGFSREPKERSAYSGGNVPFVNVSGDGGGRFGDSGGASRFFYVAKSARAERNEGCDEMASRPAGGMEGRNDGSMGSITMSKNHHPTVKPLELMKYLCQLTRTPTGGIVLDPFAGSGTTLWAAEFHNRPWIGIEKEETYVKIAEARIARERSQLKMAI